MIFSVLKAAIDEATKRISDYLQPFGYTINIVIDEPLAEPILGMYESGSVFTKEITVFVQTNNIIDTCSKDHIKDRYSDPEVQTRITIYHEVGHALVEQIIDWMENIPEINDLCNGEFGKRHAEVIEDDTDEEILVEDFAYGIEDNKETPLSACWREMNQFISES